MSLLEVISDGLFPIKFLFARQALMKKVYSLLGHIQNLDWTPLLFLFRNLMHSAVEKYLVLQSRWNLIGARHLLWNRDIGHLCNIFRALLIFIICTCSLFLTSTCILSYITLIGVCLNQWIRASETVGCKLSDFRFIKMNFLRQSNKLRARLIKLLCICGLQGPVVSM